MIVNIVLGSSLILGAYYIIGVITLAFICKFGNQDDWWGSLEVETGANICIWTWPITLPFSIYIIILEPCYKRLTKFWIKFLGMK